MFKDLKKNINQKNREIEDKRENQMQLLELRDMLSERKIVLSVVNSRLHTRKGQWVGRHANRSYMK